ncbi:MetQ/NlpA family ABC transporter substrate-binding protein [Aminobacterium sp. EBM-42]|jgi:D-methionine transport system substrate-binding protein|uniref:MetQ/NlpA family ABC transporter substrate-binding protein n=1 Tax=Aminobacterium sp. EBM-42 TaxID=1918503 RepID=UPI000A6BD9C8|nr:MetQ/NlpA family ABC transporter substrate-binding protein [Aminobacterium sp. EBM-42]NLK29467.1 ABC transporter substrate-binding protein [Aminobacterium colombiense]
MKRTVGLLLSLTILAIWAAFIPNAAAAEEVIKIGATPVPHAEILKVIKEDIAKEGIKLEIIEFTDYVKPNLALNDKEIDANYYQHLPYLENFNANHRTKLAAIGTVHVEAMGLFSEKVKHIDELKEKSLIAVPSDSVNGGRALLLLQANGLITLSDKAGLEATERDIVENPKKLRFKSIEAAQLPRILPDVDGAVINGNYALEAGFNPTEDAVLLEGSESPYANIVVVHEDSKDDEKFAILMKHLNSEKVAQFILSTYNGGVTPAF